MSEGRDDPGIDLGVYGRREAPRGLTAAEWVAAGASVLWVLASGGFFLTADASASGGAGNMLLALVAVFLPVAMVWVAATSVRTARIWREDAARLQAAIDALRHAYVAQSQSASMAVKPSVERKLDAIAASQKSTESTLATFVSRRDPVPSREPQPRAPQVAAQAAQPSLALGTPGEALAEPLAAADLIRALNFPDDQNDREGFRALRRALEDREASRLVRASQDVLTLLSQDGIYMDDLAPDRARPEVWRRFAEGERGRAVAALGGVRDRSSLALATARMRQDEIFRDAAHHFLRHFDRGFAAFAQRATDQEITDLADTRTARAFMLLGRVTGIFD